MPHGLTIAYVETSIISFYHEVRTEPDMVARRDWTRQWWDSAADSHRLVTSPAVLGELENGDFPSKGPCLDLARSLPLLGVDPKVIEIAHAYIKRKLMPASIAGDALHLALASHHRCDFLVTWNCRHLANANKFDHLRKVNFDLGLFVPTLVTPLELIGGS